MRRVDKILKRNGTSLDAVMTEVLLENLDRIAQIDLMIAVAEKRRDKILAEIEARRMLYLRALPPPFPENDATPQNYSDAADDEAAGAERPADDIHHNEAAFAKPSLVPDAYDDDDDNGLDKRR